MDGFEEQRQNNLAVSHLYGSFYSTEHGLMLADAEALAKKEVRLLPLNYYELEKTSGIFGNLLGIVLGPQPSLTAAYRLFLDCSYVRSLQ